MVLVAPFFFSISVNDEVVYESATDGWMIWVTITSAGRVDCQYRQNSLVLRSRKSLLKFYIDQIGHKAIPITDGLMNTMNKSEPESESDFDLDFDSDSDRLDSDSDSDWH